jgi:hypothetical protein
MVRLQLDRWRSSGVVRKQCSAPEAVERGCARWWIACAHRLAPTLKIWETELVSLAASTAQLPADSAGDLEYVRTTFAAMDEAVRPLVERGVLPQATYVLPDGTPMVPRDHAALLDDVGGDPDAVAGRFRERFLAAGGDAAAVDDEHEAWLSGEYGACLWRTTPETIVAKSGLMAAITALLAEPRERDQRWQAAVRGAVDALDALERPFARYDRERFGGPSSRDRLITATRERFADLWP